MVLLHLAEGTGLEPPQQSSGKTSFSQSGGAESGAVGARMAPFSRELGKVIKAWPTLSEKVRARIVAMVEEVTDKRPE